MLILKVVIQEEHLTNKIKNHFIKNFTNNYKSLNQDLKLIM